jgi:hypothetical protein
MRIPALLSAAIAATVCIAGCGHHEKPLTATAEDIDQAQQQAQKEVADARAEASKDIKSASKVSSQDVAMAKVVGAFDVAMAKADGDHTIATEKCLTLPAEQQAACTSGADTDYEAAKAKAKAARLAKMQ